MYIRVPVTAAQVWTMSAGSTPNVGDFIWE
jgi:hypothetical protein